MFTLNIFTKKKWRKKKISNCIVQRDVIFGVLEMHKLKDSFKNKIVPCLLSEMCEAFFGCVCCTAILTMIHVEDLSLFFKRALGEFFA